MKMALRSILHILNMRAKITSKEIALKIVVKTNLADDKGQTFVHEYGIEINLAHLTMRYKTNIQRFIHENDVEINLAHIDQES